MSDHKPTTITLPPEWREEFEKAAKAAGQSLSTWLGEAGMKRLPPAIREGLPPLNKRGRPKKTG
jgi:hypothetical protein